MSFFGGGKLLGPGEGEVSEALGLTFSLKAMSTDTGGAYFAFEFELPPGAGVPPHTHDNEEEAILVVSGELTNSVGDEVAKSRAGSFCFVPRGTVHSQTNDSGEPVKLFLILSPADVEGMFLEMHGKTDDEVLELMPKYGMNLVGN